MITGWSAALILYLKLSLFSAKRIVNIQIDVTHKLVKENGIWNQLLFLAYFDL